MGVIVSVADGLLRGRLLLLGLRLSSFLASLFGLSSIGVGARGDAGRLSRRA